MTKKEKLIYKHAKIAYGRILGKLRDRSQFDWWYDPIDKETKREIEGDIVNDIWVSIADAIREEHETTAK